MIEEKNKTLVVVTGPTGVGKTAVAIELAQRLGCEIVNADSRQVFRDIPIGTAAPTTREQALVKHHFVQFKNLDEYYSAAQFEEDVMNVLPQLWAQGDFAVMCGGSMMYVDAVCKGIDFMPDVSHDVRLATKRQYREEGLEKMLEILKTLDPEYFEIVDKKNPKRVVHAVEVCRETGQPYTSFRTGHAKRRPFNIVKLGLNVKRPVLFDRINRRVDRMIAQGLEQEARRVEHLRHLNSLNTAGYKEMFAHFDGKMDFNTACERIKKNTRVYAKKQLTWFAKDASVVWCRPGEAVHEALRLIDAGR